MLSITNLKGTSGNISGYLLGKDNYYTRTEGQWQGKGAEALGLTGKVEENCKS